MAVCGRLEPDNTVTVELTWDRAKPESEIAFETVRLCVFGAGCTEYAVTIPGQRTITGLAPGVTYQWSVLTTFTDGTTNESEPEEFTAAVSREPPRNLTDRILSNDFMQGARTEHTWEHGEGPGLQYDDFILGHGEVVNGEVVRRDQIYTARKRPEEVPATIADGLEPGLWAWDVVSIFDNPPEGLKSRVKALDIETPPQPVGEKIMPVSLWHAINYWVSWHRVMNSRFINVDRDLSDYEVMAAISGAENWGHPWVLNPCALNPDSGARGPYQFILDSDKTDLQGRLLTPELACTAWKSTEVAAKMMFYEQHSTGCNRDGVFYGSRICEWAVWRSRAMEFYNLNMRNQQWFLLFDVHKASATCTDNRPCPVAIVDLTGRVAHRLDIDFESGTYNLSISVWNNTPIPAVFTVIALDAPGWEVAPGPDLWLPDASGQLILSPAKTVWPNSVEVWTVNLRPGNSPGVPVYYIYGENVGIGPLGPNSELKVYQATTGLLAPITATVDKDRGDNLAALVEFDHRGPPGELELEVTLVSGNRVIKTVSSSVRVSRDSRPARYGQEIKLGRVFQDDPSGDWDAVARVLSNNQELARISRVKVYRVS